MLNTVEVVIGLAETSGAIVTAASVTVAEAAAAEEAASSTGHTVVYRATSTVVSLPTGQLVMVGAHEVIV